MTGATPIVRLQAIEPDHVEIWAKLEWFNPTGSVKDRVALAMLDAAEADGLEPGTQLLEPSSGNTGIALARLAQLRGYPLTVVVPQSVTEERKELLRAFGATLVESPGDEGSNGAITMATQMAADGSWHMLFQYENAANPRAHEEGTGPEILEAVGPVDAFVAGLGTGGTLMGVGRALRAAKPDTSIVAAEPPSGDAVSGLRSLDDGYLPPIFDPEAIDGKILVRTGDAVAMTRRLLAEEGLFAGLSSGAAVHAALRWARRMDGGKIVVLLPDGGWKYLSTGAWHGSVEDAVARLEGTVYF